MPAWAAEEANDVEINNYSNLTISENTINLICQNAKEAIKEERTNKINTPSSRSVDNERTYTYYTNDENYIYVYEEANGLKSTMTIYDAPKDSEIEIFMVEQLLNNLQNSIMPMGLFDPGIGGKQTITKTGSAGSYFTTKVTLPTTSQVSDPNYAYIYGSFSKSNDYEADFGMLYSNTNGPDKQQYAWRIYANLVRYIPNGNNSYWQKLSMELTDKAASYRNGYKPGTDVNMSIWYNNNKKTKLVLEGTTICPTHEGTELKDTQNTSIYESSALWNIPSIDYFKVCATITSGKTGKNYAIFDNIKVDNVPVTSASYYPNPSKEKANVTRTSNTVIINVNSSIY
ncbi:MAG TPA: hypothetical protein IAB00_01210 [Candidatus Avidehalobacter gallistercoris]|uniref:Uncharacterized protein n=1 Tax=Candidatus Avidehalobacter gallistercoris TaxID=2840694 RepID=A0A9D1HIU1_9FIRM|nr:hypothetical protein [Candidatus Avidehalobacter gallistercoris]